MLVTYVWDVWRFRITSTCLYKLSWRQLSNNLRWACKWTEDPVCQTLGLWDIFVTESWLYFHRFYADNFRFSLLAKEPSQLICASVLNFVGCKQFIKSWFWEKLINNSLTVLCPHSQILFFKVWLSDFIHLTARYEERRKPLVINSHHFVCQISHLVCL